jgi:acyl-CoA reductase-like NAD-dependent aldehyde dehydrogenase
MSYSSYVDGRDAESIGWVYTVSSQSLLEDVFTSVSLKRALEKDPDPESAAAQHPYVVGRCGLVDDDTLDRAVDAADAAVRAWAAVPLEQRIALGTRFRDRLVKASGQLEEILIAEAHPRSLARWEIAGLMHVFSDESCDWYRRQLWTEFEHGGRRLIVRRQADGVVCLFPPQNAPAPTVALAVLALMGGNAVVARAPRSIALSTLFILRELVVPLLEEMDAPPGVLNIVCGRPGPMLERWLAHPKVADIFYFGDVKQGLKFERACVERGKKAILELAGNDGVLVWKDADIAWAAEAVTESFFGSGQICMVPNYVLVHPDVAEEFLAELVRVTETIRPGFPDDEKVLLSPVRRSERFFALLRQAIAHGAEILTGGRRLEVDGTPSESGVFLEPTVVRVDGLERAREYDVVREETFFPLLPVVVPEARPDAELLDAMVDFMNANPYGLRNSLWSASPEVIGNVVTHLRNGGLLKVNDSHIGFQPYVPNHGGTGLTGGAYGEANYPILRTTHLQGVSISAGFRPREAVFEA